MLLSVLYVRHRDIQPIWEVVSQALFYASPVLYVATMIPENIQRPYHANPLAALLTEMRAALIDPEAAHVWVAIGGAERLLLPGRDRGRRVRARLVGVQPRGAADRRAPLAMGLAERVRALARQSRPTAAEPSDWTTRDVPVAEIGAQPIARRLLDRLRPEDVEAVEASLDGELATLWHRASPTHRAYLALAFGVHHRVPARARAHRPDGRRAAARGPRDGPRPARGRRRLLLRRPGRGGARGRRRRPRRRAPRPRLRLLVGPGAAPAGRRATRRSNGTAWTRTPRPSPGRASTCRESRSPLLASDPPLDFPDGHFDFVYAISIWSHFGERSARAWLEEMHRIVAPGGHLVLTVHGAQSIAHASRSARASRRSSRRSPWPSTGAGSGTRRSSARRAITASCTRSGAPRS